MKNGNDQYWIKSFLTMSQVWRVLLLWKNVMLTRIRLQGNNVKIRNNDKNINNSTFINNIDSK
jgi:hypothetical protein